MTVQAYNVWTWRCPVCGNENQLSTMRNPFKSEVCIECDRTSVVESPLDEIQELKDEVKRLQLCLEFDRKKYSDEMRQAKKEFKELIGRAREAAVAKH